MRANNLLVIVFGFLLSIIRILSITGLTTQTMWQIKQRLFDYESYYSIQLTSFTVPSLAVRSTWIFSAYMSDQKCDVHTAFISLQSGGYPLVAPLNETFPPFFHLHRSHQVTLHLHTDNSTLSYRLENPIAGSWYALSVLEYDSAERIKQKGLGVDCSFYLDVVHHVMSAEDIPVLVAGTTTSAVVHYEQASLFRFLTEESTTKYTIKISNCSITNCSDPSCSAYDSCPIRVSSRSQAFPTPSRNDTHSVNCSTSSCLLEKEQPVTADWQYIMVECLQPGNVSLSLTVVLEGCLWAHLSTMATPSFHDPVHSGFPVGVITTENPTLEEEVSEGYVRAVSLRPPEADGRDLSVLGEVTQRNPSVLEQVTSSPEYFFGTEEHSRHGTKKGMTNSSCLRLNDFGRFSEAGKTFGVTYRRRYGAYPLMNLVQMTGNEVVVAAFHVEPLLDSGGTLKLEANLLVSYLNDTSQILVIELCLVKSRIPISNGILSCPLDSPQLEISSETGKNASGKVYIPYPESGVWFVAMAARCYGNVGLSQRVLEQCRLGGIMVNSTVSLSACVDNECGLQGSCREYFSGVLHFSSCYCYYGYRGYGCTDSTNAQSDAYQLTSVLLLTLSNLFFVPSIVVSIYRRYFTEAFVYFFAMFISSFYHACDGDNKYTICIMPYNVLSFCDFLVAIVSFWVTLVTMARLPLQWTSFSYVVAILALAMGVEWDKHSLWTFLVPSIVAGLIMIVSWVWRCQKRRTCYPSRRRWLFFIVPGIGLALLGLIIYAGLETESNYQYTHSAWHVCIALCIVFLLPPRSLKRTTEDDSLCSLCVKGEDDVSVMQCSVPKEEGQPPQSDPLMATHISTSFVSANGDIHQADKSTEDAFEDDIRIEKTVL